MVEITKKIITHITLLLFISPMPIFCQYWNFKTLAQNAKEMRLLPLYDKLTEKEEPEQLRQAVKEQSVLQANAETLIDNVYIEACILVMNFKNPSSTSTQEIERRKKLVCSHIIATSGSRIKDFDLGLKMLWYVPLFVKDLTADLNLHDASLQVFSINNNQKFLDSFKESISKCYPGPCLMPESVKRVNNFMLQYQKKIEEAAKRIKDKINAQKASDIFDLGNRRLRMLTLKSLLNVERNLWKKEKEKILIRKRQAISKTKKEKVVACNGCTKPQTKKKIVRKIVIKEKLKIISGYLSSRMDDLIENIEDKIPRVMKALIKNPRLRLLKGTKIPLDRAKERCEKRFGKNNCVKFDDFSFVFKCAEGKKPVKVNSHQFQCSQPDGFSYEKVGKMPVGILDLKGVYDISFVHILDK